MAVTLKLPQRSGTLTLATRRTALKLGLRSSLLHLRDAMTDRQVLEQDLTQGLDEEIIYSFSTTPWGSTPSAVSVKAFDITNGDRTDVTATVFPAGAAGVVGDVITLPALKALTYAHVYRIEVQFTSGSSKFEPYFIVTAEQ